MSEEPTLSLEELGEIKTVRVYNQAFVDKQQKRIAELEAQIEKMKCCENCRRNTPFFFCEECTRFKGPLSPTAFDNWELKED